MNSSHNFSDLNLCCYCMRKHVAIECCFLSACQLAKGLHEVFSRVFRFFPFSCAVLGCRHRKAHYRFISEIIIDFFFSNACQRQECNLNEFHSIAASKHMLTRNNYRRNGWGRKKLTFVVIVGAMMMFYFWCNLALWAWLMNVNLWPNFHSNGGSFFLYAASHSGF